jgi:hypothetical protein
MDGDSERDREFYQAQDARYDRDRAVRERAESDRRGWRALAGGDTAEAIREFAGPDAAMSYLESRADESDSMELDDEHEEPGGGWPPHGIARDLNGMLANLESLPHRATVRTRHDQDGDLVVEASVDGAPLGQFWANVGAVERYLAYTDELVLSSGTERIVAQLRDAIGG